MNDITDNMAQTEIVDMESAYIPTKNVIQLKVDLTGLIR